VGEIGGRGGGDDAVDHAGRAGAVGREPRREIGGAGGEPLGHQRRQLPAVVGEVVAGEQGEAGVAGGGAAGESLGEQRVETALGQSEVEGAVGGAAIAFFGDGEGHEMRGGGGEAIDDLGAVVGGEEDLGDAGDDLGVGLGAGAFGEGVEAVLRVQSRAHVRRAERDTGDHPVAAPGAHGMIGVPREMRAGEGAEAEVDDADGPRAVIGRGAGGGVEAGHSL